MGGWPSWRLTIPFAHSLFPHFGDAWRLMERYDNVWLEMTNVFASLWDPRYILKEYASQERMLREGIGPHSERIMFGTDHPSGLGTLGEIYEVLDAAGLREDVKERLLGATAERFVQRFWPDFPRRIAGKPRGPRGA